MAEGGGLLNRCRGLNLYPGFESLPHRHPSLMTRAKVPTVALAEVGSRHARTELRVASERVRTRGHPPTLPPLLRQDRHHDPAPGLLVLHTDVLVHRRRNLHDPLGRLLSDLVTDRDAGLIHDFLRRLR